MVRLLWSEVYQRPSPPLSRTTEVWLMGYVLHPWASVRLWSLADVPVLRHAGIPVLVQPVLRRRPIVVAAGLRRRIPVARGGVGRKRRACGNCSY